MSQVRILQGAPKFWIKRKPFEEMIAQILGGLTGVLLVVFLTSCKGTEGKALCVKEGEVGEESFHSPSLTEEPFEEWNRFIFGFNQAIDDGFFEPISSVYETLFPFCVRQRIHNALLNLAQPFLVLNHVLEGEFEKAGTTTAIF